MSWLGRKSHGQSAKATSGDIQPELQELMSAGFDCESRADLPGAERAYRRVIELEPQSATAHFYLGRLASHDLRRAEAVTLLEKAVDLAPGEALYHLALGDALFAVEDYAAAAQAYLTGVNLQPDATVMRNNYATALIHLNRRDEARAELERMRTLLPEVPQIHFNLGGIYREYAQTAEAIACYRRALELTPGHVATFSNLLFELNYGDGSPESVYAEHRRFGEVFARRYVAPRTDPAWPRRLRIGYVSPDLRNHVVARFFEPILAHHDRGRFEVFCYFTHHDFDHISERLRALVDHWLDCDELSDDVLAERIRKDQIDILIDLAGHTVGNRLGVFGMKPAPIQATYLGYPNTTGLAAIDYRITDGFADPEAVAEAYSVERLVRVPQSYFCYRPDAGTPDVSPSPAIGGRAVTFGCFSNFAKMSDGFFDAAVRVLEATPGSRLLLKSRPLSIPEVSDRVRQRFFASNIDPERIELLGWEKGSKGHLSTYGRIDIALDSFPYAGATTTCEALWMGVPVVSLAGKTHAGRMGVSLLHSVGLERLVARDVDHYVALAAELAKDRTGLAELRAGLRDRMRQSPLMDEAGFTRSLEQCYLDMWAGHLRPAAVALAPGWIDGRLDEVRRLRAEGRFQDAMASGQEVLRVCPAHRETLALVWDLAFDMGSPGASVDWLLKALAVEEGVASTHYMLGCALQAMGRNGDAIDAFARAVELEPGFAKAHNNLGCVLELSGRLQNAEQAYRRAAELDTGLAQAHYNLGKLQLSLGRISEAVASMKKGVAMDASHADWHCQLGEVLYRERQLEDAVHSFRAAIAIDPSFPQPHKGLAHCLLALGQVDEALAAMRSALDLVPGDAGAESWLLLNSHCRPDQASSAPERHRGWAQRHAKGHVHLVAPESRDRGSRRRLNVGYVIDGFPGDPARFLEPVLAAHDRRRFKIFSYASAMGGDADIERRHRALGSEWREISRFTDDGLAHRIRTDGIDILVDLGGHAGGRLLAFARRPAPVQVSWLGYPDTTGVPTLDYRITDAVADPAGSERLYTETLVRLERGCVAFAPAEGEPILRRAQPARPLTFACFEELSRISTEMVVLWSTILRATPAARLMIRAHGLSAQGANSRLTASFAQQGVEATRLDLSAPGNEPPPYDAADVMLDVSPWNGFQTTCQALWSGLPVVTLAGTSFASRVGASILASAGLPELIAETPDQYCSIALRLARDPQALSGLSGQLRGRLRASPLLDTAGFTQRLETAYSEMWAGVLSPSAEAPA